MKLDKKTKSRKKKLFAKRKKQMLKALADLERFNRQRHVLLAAPASPGGTSAVAVPTATDAETGLIKPSSPESLLLSEMPMTNQHAGSLCGSVQAQ